MTSSSINSVHGSWKRRFASNNMIWPPFWCNVGRYGIDAVYVYAGLLRCGRRSKMEETIFTRRGCRCLKCPLIFLSFVFFFLERTPDYKYNNIFQRYCIWNDGLNNASRRYGKSGKKKNPNYINKKHHSNTKYIEESYNKDGAKTCIEANCRHVWNRAVLAQFHHQASSDGYSQGMVPSESAAILL